MGFIQNENRIIYRPSFYPILGQRKEVPIQEEVPLVLYPNHNVNKMGKSISKANEKIKNVCLTTENELLQVWRFLLHYNASSCEPKSMPTFCSHQ